MKRKLVIGIAIGAASGAVIGAAAFAWLALRAPLHWPVRALGFERSASLRLRWGLLAAHALGRRAIVLVGDSRLEQLGPVGLGTSEDVVVPAAFAGVTAGMWRGVLATTSLPQRPATYVVWLGVNDLVNERASADDTIADLEAIVERIARGSAHRVLLLEQIPVRYPQSPEAARLQAANEQINRALAALAARDAHVQLVPLWTRFGGGAGDDTNPCKDCYADALHLSEHGERVLRGLLNDALQREP